MPPERDRRRDAQDGLIWTRDNVVITSRRGRDDGLTYYLKLIETEEIFELGELEYLVWQQFQGGQTLEAAERAAVARLGSGFRSRFRALVAELAIRDLLYGAIPDELLAEFQADPRARRIRLQHQIDPDDRPSQWLFNRFPLFEPNRPFSLLARWFGFLKHAVWPIGIIGVLGALVLMKHSTEMGVDMHALQRTSLVGYTIPHIVVMLFTIKLVRNIVLATVIRYYGAEIRVFSLDLLFGFWPRFHVDKRGLLRLARTPQLWAHSSPFFARLFFFGSGALGWWWFRDDGTTRSELCLMLSRAGLFDMILSMLPFRRGPGVNETYYWFCAYFEEPFLRERAWAAFRGVFSRGAGAFELPSIEWAALFAYGLSMIASALLLAFVVVSLIITLTGQYNGAGFALFIAAGLVMVFWKVMGQRIKALKSSERRERRRSARLAAQLAPAADE